THSPPDHLVGRRLFPYYIAHYCAPDYLEKTPAHERVWVVPSHADQRPDWIDTSPIPDARISMAIDDATMRHRAAIAGHGMIRGACYMDDPNPSLVRLPGSVPIPKQDIWVLTHPDLRETPRIKLVIRFLIDALISKRDLIEGKRPRAIK
ncbi:MAG: LysR substrate-binding domain-containing protein, partial [Pseudomonadota bacterium]